MTTTQRIRLWYLAAPFLYLCLPVHLVLAQVPGQTQRTYTGSDLARLQTAHLLALLTFDSVHTFGGLNSVADTILQILVQRKAVQRYLETFERSKDDYQIFHVKELLTRLRSPSVDSTLRQIGSPDSLSFKALCSHMYFAEDGQSWALSVLNKNFWDYQVANIDRQDIIAVFGQYRYAPGARNLLKALHSIDMTTFGMADDALHRIYPEASDTMPTSVEDTQQFWEQYLRAHQAGSLKKGP